MTGDGVWSLAARVCAAAGTLAVVAVASRTLVPIEFAVWAVLTTISAVIAFSDLGVANAATSDLASAVAVADDDCLARTSSAATALLVVIAVIMAVVALAATTLLELRPLFGVPPGSGTDVAASVRAYLLLLAIAVPLGLGSRLLIALGHSRSLAKIVIAGVTVQLALAAAAGMMRLGLVAFAVVAASSPVITGTASWIVAMRLHSGVIPRWQRGILSSAGPLVRRSGGYTLIGAAAAIGYETDALIIAARLGAEEAATYAVTAKVFLLVPSLITAYFTPLWPLVARLRILRDGEELRKLWRRSTSAAVAAGGASAATLTALAPHTVNLLFAEVATPSTGLILVLAALVVVHAFGAPVAAFLSGLNLVVPQAASAAIMAVLNVGLSLLLVGVIGAIGPPIATIAAQTCATLVPMTFILARTLRRAGVPRVDR